MRIWITLLLWGSLSVAFARDGSKYEARTISPALLEDAHTVIREYEETFMVKSPSEGVHRVRVIVTVLNSESKAGHIQSYYDDDTRITKLWAALYDANGNRLQYFGKADFENRSAISAHSLYEDTRVRHLEVGSGSYPYTIEYEIERKVSGRMFFSYPDYRVQSFGESVEQSRFEVSLPADMKLHYQSININLKPEVGEESGRSIYAWHTSQLPAIERLPYGPSADRVLPRVRVSPDRFQFESYRGSMESWSSFGDFVYRLWVGRDRISPELKQTVQQLTAHCRNNEEKVAVLYRFLQQNTRYVSLQLGIGGYQTFPASYVEKNQYGDCKALTNYMKSLLGGVNITAYPALIRAGETTVYDTEFAFSDFNHVILYLPTEDAWLECTSISSPLGYVGSPNAGKTTLLMTPMGGQLKKTPALTPDDNHEHFRVKLSMEESGRARFEHNAAHQGTHQEYLRYLATMEERADLQKRWVKQGAYRNVTLIDFQVEPDPAQPTVAVKASGECDYATRSGTRIFVPVLPALHEVDVPKKFDPQRSAPIQRTEGQTATTTITLTMPSGFSLEAQPGATVVEDERFGVYRLELTKIDDQTVKVTRTLRLEPFEVAAAEGEAYRAFMKRISKSDRAKMVWFNDRP